MRIIECQVCGVGVMKRGPGQKYCKSCSEKRDLERKGLWASKHPPNKAQRQSNAISAQDQVSRARAVGDETNHAQAMNIAWDGRSGPNLIWQVFVSVPFSYAASKNHIYTHRRAGHVTLRRESVAIRDHISLALMEVLQTNKFRVVHNKVWLDILVQKANHKGDAVNFVDLVCDAVKRAIPVDDRWFCIRRVDWQVVRVDPKIFVGVGQESDEDAQVCSYCGQIRSLVQFQKHRGGHLGVGRECKECLSKAARHKTRKKRNELSRRVAGVKQPQLVNGDPNADGHGTQG